MLSYVLLTNGHSGASSMPWSRLVRIHHPLPTPTRQWATEGRTLGLAAREVCLPRRWDNANYSGTISLKLQKHTQLKGEEEAGRKRGHGLMGPAVTPPGRATVPSPQRDLK